MSKLRCDICGGQIEMQPDKRGLCLNCGTSYSLATMKEMFSGVKVSVTGSSEDVEQWRQLLDKYYSAGDFTEAERVVKKILEAIPNDAQASEKYEQLQVLKYMDIRNGVLKKYSGNTKVLLIPDIVTEIDEAVFSGNKYIEEVELPNGLSEIQASLFSGCSNLKRVSIPDTVTVIGTKAFESCVVLGSIEIPGRVEMIGDGAFSYCRSLKKVNIPASVRYIGTEGRYMRSVGAFAGCSMLKVVKMYQGLKILGNKTFSGTALEDVELPDGLEAIGEEAFGECLSLKRLVIPDSVVSLYEEDMNVSDWKQRFPWKGCYKLEVIEYPKRFNPGVFAGTVYYKNVIQPQMQKAYDQRRWKNAGLCQYCGGSFGLFSGSCKKCGRAKDY